VTFGYPGHRAPLFENVHLRLDTDWKLGFVGRNGYGKTTFLNLLRGILPFEGQILSPVEFGYFPFSVDCPDRSTRRVILALKPEIPFWRLQREMNLLDVKEEVLERPFSSLSGGERTKVLLAVLFTEDKFMLIDEPTNHLDLHGRRKTAGYLRQKSGFILVSHDRDFLNGAVDHILAIEKSKITVMTGNYDTWDAVKRLKDRFELEQNERLRGEVRRLRRSAGEKSEWSDRTERTKYRTEPGGMVDRGYVGHRAAKMMKRAKNVERRLDRAIGEKEALLKNVETTESLEIRPLRHHAALYVEAKGFSLSYGERAVFAPTTFALNRGDRLVLSGVNGSGKSSLLGAVLGEGARRTGTLSLAAGLTMSRVVQSADWLRGSVEDLLRSSRTEKTLFLTTLSKLGLPRERFGLPMETFSMGERKKVLLALSIAERAHLYVWDEPLNFLDVYSRVQIEEMILEYAPTMLLVEHDARFVDRVATGVVELRPLKG
jgi:lincosamide and streptogramin A transport system ATP-binding/permease protein